MAPIAECLCWAPTLGAVPAVPIVAPVSSTAADAPIPVGAAPAPATAGSWAQNILSATRTPPAPSIILFCGGWYILVSAGHAQPTAHHTRGRGSIAFPLPGLAYPRPSSCRAHGGPQFRASQLRMPSSGRTNSAVASGVLMAMAHYASAYHRRCILVVLGEVLHKKTYAEKAARACGAWLALAAARARAHPCTIKKQQHSFNHNFPMRAIMYSCCHECIHVSRLHAAPIY